ncbi:MAG: hypothetical protein NVS9B10_05770 [Nevskia sp.]
MTVDREALARLTQAIDAELALPLPAGIATMAAWLAAQGHGTAVAVLFYGSNLRSGALDGVLDFYVLVDSLRGWYRHWLPAAANRVLPPNILYFERDQEGRTLRAKVAVLRVDQFRAAMRAGSLDTTMWARYSQPAGLAWVRDEAGRHHCGVAIAQAVVSAGRWAARLGPAAGRAEDYWEALFRRTYGAELRVEKASRAQAITAWAEARYTALLPLAWRSGGTAFALEDGNGLLQPAVTPLQRRLAQAGWTLRHLLGKPLNFLRLVKSAYTFDGGVDYLLWKIERHSGVKFELKPWQRRHPILAAPGVIWQLRRRGVIR